jgi:hypothetical protein
MGKPMNAVSPTGEYDRRHREGISRLAALAKWFIRGVTALIALVFAGLTLKDIPFAAFSDANPQYFQAFLLTAYIWCWAAGTTLDTNLQSSAYLVDPQRGRLRWGSLAAVASLAAISLAMLFVRTNALYFSLALLLFTSIDLATWFYLRLSLLPPIIEASRKKYNEQQDYYGLIQLELVVHQIIGSWKYVRHATLFALILLMVLLALSPRLQGLLSNEVHAIVPAAPADKVGPLLPDFLLLVFLVVSELWYFAVRLRTLLTIRLLNEMESRFTISPRLEP